MRTTSRSRSEEAPRYWFAAKQYGWGWGLPLTWQGWVVLAAYVAGVTLAALLGDERTFSISAGVLTVLLIAVCAIKGEPPRWRWGGKD